MSRNSSEFRESFWVELRLRCMDAAASNATRLSTCSGTPPTADQLPDDLGTLKRMILELLATLQEERRARARLQHRVAQVLQRLSGPRGERFRPDLPLLFPERGQPTDTAWARIRPRAGEPGI